MRKDIFVKDIKKEGIDVNDLFIVSKKNIFTGKNNAKYMSIELKDKTGSIEGKVWENVDNINKLFEKNDLVFVKAKMRLYQEKPQLTVSDIRRFDNVVNLEDMSAFFPEAEPGIDNLKKVFFQLLNEIEEPHIASLFSALIRRNDILEKFFLFPASIGVHHVYLGGLLEHSLSMAQMGKNAADITGADKDIIIAGSLLHDIGKVEELCVKGGFQYSDRGRLMGHIALGTIMFEEIAKEVNEFPEHISDMLAHIIISHHGVEEWGSPKKPMSIEALIVHYLDDLDAKVMGVKEHMKENMADKKWTEYHKLYESRFYKLPER
ncbi:MAG: HD domain-containing protein [Proteobacteria bacterium]|nr:HD domain-containing protein [Pseudomonadota bacterium]